jgi:hypothetical protein
MLLKLHSSADSIPSALTIFSITWQLRVDLGPTDCVLFVSLLNPTAGHGGHLIDVLVLVLHGCAHGRVSHDIHDRKQVFGRPIHLSSKAMTRAVEDEVLW